MTNLGGPKSLTAFSGIALCAALALSATGCGGSSVSNTLGINSDPITITGVAEAEVSPATTATPIEDAAVTFVSTAGQTTGATTDVNGNFTLDSAPGGAQGYFTFTNNTTEFISPTITLPSSSGTLSSDIVCTTASSVPLVKK